MAFLVDTSILVHIERRAASWREELAKFTGGEAVALSAITVAELLVGLHRADSDARRLRRRQYIDDLCDSLTVLPYDTEAARVHARLWADLGSSGQLIGQHDMIIAATALTNGFGILTSNLREFSRIPGLTVRQPSW